MAQNQNNMTTQSHKRRAVILAALMVLSVFAVSVAFVGTAAAGDREVSADATIFQGEDNITFNSTDFGSQQLVGQSGNAEGLILTSPIPETQTPGTYGAGGNNTTVVEPKITDFDILNEDGNDVSGSTLLIPSSSTNEKVVVDYNFGAAEDIELTVTDADGLDVTSEWTSSPKNATDGTAQITFDSTNVDTGVYTFEVAGAGDLDFGDATQTTTITVIDEESASITAGTANIVTGEDLTFTVTGLSEDEYVGVYVKSGDFDTDVIDSNASTMFRNVGDTTQTGFYDTGSNSVIFTDGSTTGAAGTEIADYAYAILQIDGGQAVGSINSDLLHDDEVELFVTPALTGTQIDTTAGGETANSFVRALEA